MLSQAQAPQGPAPRVETAFLSPSRAAELVRRTGVIQTLRGMVRVLEEDFGRWQEFEKSARTANHSPQGVIELMPVSDQREFAFKYVNGHPVNTRSGLLTVMAFGALARVDTGMPAFISELTLTTALRTAATSAMVARRLARPDSQVMALIGNGAQSEFQALAFHDLLGIRQLRLYDVDASATRKLAANLAPYGLDVVCCASTDEALRGADIVTTVTADKAYATILAGHQVRPGMHVNAVGGDCPGKTELAAEVLRKSRVFVEYEPQTRIEGDLQQMPADFEVTEFWRVLRGEAPGRTSAAQITVFDSVGFALEDYSALRYMRALASAAGLLERLELIPELANPKNLFALLQQPAPAAAPASPSPSARAVTLIGAPTDAGAGRLGAAMGPDALRVAQLGPALRRFGIDVRDIGNLAGPPNPQGDRVEGLRNLAEAVRWNHAVHDAVAATLREGRMPIVLGGDHQLAIGSISAVARHCRAQGRRLRILWLDAHSDCNTPEVSPTGNIHGMPVASLYGLGPRSLASLSDVVPAIRPDALCQIGLRSVDEAEKRMIGQLGIEVYDMRAIDELGMREIMQRALAGVAGEGVHLHLSFDVDFLDPEIAPGTGTQVRGGPNYREAQLCMEMIADTGCLGSLDIVELNPALDLRNQTAELVVDLTESLFGKSTLVAAAREPS